MYLREWLERDVEEARVTVDRLLRENAELKVEVEQLREEAAERELILAGCEAMIRDLRSEVELLRAPVP